MGANSHEMISISRESHIDWVSVFLRPYIE